MSNQTVIPSPVHSPTPPSQEMRILRATHGSNDRPLHIGETTIPCYVLEGGMRVISQRGLLTSIGLSTSGGTSGANRAARIIEGLADNAALALSLKPPQDARDFEAIEALEASLRDLSMRIDNPVLFLPPGGRMVGYGFEATILADVCEAILAANDVGLLNTQQKKLVLPCSILIRGFARVGIIALIDEATGYQADRARDALEQVLRRYISAELLKWVSTFPDDFYREIFRLRGLTYDEFSSKRPGYIGNLTNDIVYARLAPNVLEELQRITPKDEKGRRKHKYFQRLTEDVGYQKLREHLAAVVALMKASKDWRAFQNMIDRALPRYDRTPELMFNETGNAD